jgi:hypothetical protein
MPVFLYIATRLKWIEADKEASAAKHIADGLQWLVAVRVARDAAKELQARAGDSSSSTADFKEGRAERRRRGPLSFVTGAMIAPQVTVAVGAAAAVLSPHSLVKDFERRRIVLGGLTGSGEPTPS